MAKEMKDARAQGAEAVSDIKQDMKTREPAQGEIRFVENILYDEDVGDVVPEIYREHRHRFSKVPEDLEAYKRQVMYRCAHIGTKELEIVLKDYLKLHQADMTRADVEQFDDEILNIENP